MDFTACYEDTVSSAAAAARAGRAGRLRALLGGGCRIDSRDNRGWTALHEAAAAGSSACVREILAALHARSCKGVPALVNAQTHEGESACYLAAQRGHVGVVRLLLKAHADIDQMTNDLSCPLYAAVDRGHAAVVDLLVSKGAELNRTHTASCWTCLHQAVYKGHGQIVSMLVKVCNLEALDDHGISPLFVAAQYGQRESLEALIHAGDPLFLSPGGTQTSARNASFQHAGPLPAFAPFQVPMSTAQPLTWPPPSLLPHRKVTQHAWTFCWTMGQIPTGPAVTNGLSFPSMQRLNLDIRGTERRPVSRRAAAARRDGRKLRKPLNHRTQRTHVRTGAKARQLNKSRAVFR